MSVGMPMAAGIGMGMGGVDPVAAAGLGMTPGLGLGIPDATLGLGAATVAPAPPIVTECLLVSNLFDPNKLVSFFPVFSLHVFCRPNVFTVQSTQVSTPALNSRTGLKRPSLKKSLNCVLTYDYYCNKVWNLTGTNRTSDGSELNSWLRSRLVNPCRVYVLRIDYFYSVTVCQGWLITQPAKLSPSVGPVFMLYPHNEAYICLCINTIGLRPRCNVGSVYCECSKNSYC